MINDAPRRLEALEAKMWSNFTPRLMLSLNYTQQHLPRGEDRFAEHSKNLSRFLNKVSKKTGVHLSAIASVEDITRLHAHLNIYSPQDITADIVNYWKHSAEGKSVCKVYNPELHERNACYLLGKHELDNITLSSTGKVRVYCPQHSRTLGGCGASCLVSKLLETSCKH
jgi:hypothetical protein